MCCHKFILDSASFYDANTLLSSDQISGDDNYDLEIPENNSEPTHSFQSTAISTDNVWDFLNLETLKNILLLMNPEQRSHFMNLVLELIDMTMSDFSPPSSNISIVEEENYTDS